MFKRRGFPLPRMTVLMPLLMLLLSGCASTTALFFYPQSVWISTPQDYSLTYQDVSLNAADGTRLHSWWLPAQGDVADRQIMVLYLHGNAENISSHSRSVYWLVQEGISVLALDYRGFGASEGAAVMPSVLQDIEAAALWMRQQFPEKRLVVLGQSIGAALAIDFVARAADTYQISALVIEASFTGFGDIARYALGQNVIGWLVWPFTVLIPSQWDPQKHIGEIQVPVLLIHSPDDSVVPQQQGKILYQKLTDRSGNVVSCWLQGHGPHIASFADAAIRMKTLEFIYSEQCPAFTDQ